MKYIYGPIPSRRLGKSLGVSPIPKKACNYACVYCQLGRTDKMTNVRKEYYPVEEILSELEEVLKTDVEFDAVSVVGEGEPTLYSDLEKLIDGIRRLTDKPVTVITNGALLDDPDVLRALFKADIVLPSLDAYDEETFRKINRPHGRLDFNRALEGLIDFSHKFPGQLWLEIMLIKDINDDEESLYKFRKLLKRIRYDHLYLNTPVRPPAESWVAPSTPERLEAAVKLLGGTAIGYLSPDPYQSGIADDYEAILSIIRRHPMNQHEVEDFLKKRKCPDPEVIFRRLHNDERLERIKYKGFVTFRLK